MSDPHLEFRRVTFSYPGSPVFDGLSLVIEPGMVTAVIGPNGSGKTTLLRLASGVVTPSAGSVLLTGREVTRLPAREAARLLAVVPQEEPALFPFSVEETVLMGRSPWLSGLGFVSETDRRLAARCLEVVNAGDLIGRDVTELSGGERQRVLVARALAQEAPLLILDEPTSHLDLKHRVSILRLLKDLKSEEGRTVVVISHDVNLCSRFADRIVVLAGGEILGDGPPGDIVRADLLSEAYDTRVRVRHVEGLDVPMVFPD
jgi:ABC-type cobalamin/Fe3+-siderophores transport system ATPase subunit